ncbi:MAG: pyridoxamine 5'-phosphate oxidase family protein [Bacteroidota bacterium]
MLINFEDTLESVEEKVHAEIRRACVDKKHPFRFLCMASRTSSGVSQRYIVLRGIDGKGQLLFYTDARSKKVAELTTCSEVSLLLYHPNKKLQVKVEGNAFIQRHTETSQKHWIRIQGIGRRAYSPLLAPGTAIENPIEAHHWPEEMTAEHFCLIQIEIQEMEVLQLNRLEHLRASFKKRGKLWERSWIAP